MSKVDVVEVYLQHRTEIKKELARAKKTNPLWACYLSAFIRKAESLLKHDDSTRGDHHEP